MTHLVLKRLTVLPFVYDSFGEDVIMWVCLVLDDLKMVVFLLVSL